MKNISYILTLLATTMLTLTGCNKEQEQLFDGSDNGLTSLSVTANGVTYKAAITDNQITISAPIGADLSTAQVNYELCEHATIVPDPKSISNWGSEHVFRIKSYTKAPREYTYSVVRTNVAQASNVELITQSDVEAFLKLGVTVIDGNLSIGADTKPVLDSIFNLEGLASLREVRYNIIINRSFAGGTLKGLENIEKCGGLHIGTTTSQIEFPAQSGLSIELPALRAAGDIILNSNSIKSISLIKLESASTLFISSNSLVGLKLPQLKQTVGALSMENASGSINSILSDITFPRLETVGGKLSMQYFSGVTAINLPMLTAVGGDINLGLNAFMLEQLTLPELSTVKGAVIIERAPGVLKFSIPKVKHLTSFAYNKSSYGTYPLTTLDLPSLETIDNELYLRGLAIEQVELPVLTTIGGDVILWDLKSATSIKMPVIKKMGKKLQLYSINQLEMIDISPLDTLANLELIGCMALKTIKSPVTIGDLTINYASNAACPTPEFVGLEQIAGKFDLTNDYQTKRYQIKHIKQIATLKLGGGATGAVLDMPHVEKIGSFELSSSNLEQLLAPQLREVENLKFSYIAKLTTLQIPLLKTVGLFSLSEHNSWGTNTARMTDLSPYKDITSIGSVKISFCNKLVDFSALGGVIPTLTADKWSVTDCGYNPTYENMVNGSYTKP